MHNSPSQRPGPTSEEAAFTSQAAEARPGVVSELFAFIRDNKKWWLTPIIVVLLLVGVLIVLGGTAAAPFIYTLF
jgi:Family of unknown function (DUF5989)